MKRKQVKKAVKKLKNASPKSIFLAVIFFVVVIAGYYVYNNYIKKTDPFVEAKGEISFHFMTLGNQSSGDSIYIKAGDNDILIDAGSTTGSIDDIQKYVDKHVTDGTLEYVIATHADGDHIAGFSKKEGSIFDIYKCKTIIDFPISEKSSETYKTYKEERADEISSGAKHYTALECYNNVGDAKRVYDLSVDGNVKMEILYNYFYENDSADENNYSVCIMFHHGSRQFLFTGDLEQKGEEYLAEKYDFSQVELFKAGHHGSETSSNDCLLNEIKPKICVVSCVIGDKHNFIRQPFIERISKWTDKVYVTSICTEGYTNGAEYADMNGNIVVTSDEELGVTVKCSNNDTLLKDTQWFKDYRTMPNTWKN